jgi:hypothetical protein
MATALLGFLWMTTTGIAFAFILKRPALRLSFRRW